MSRSTRTQRQSSSPTSGRRRSVSRPQAFSRNAKSLTPAIAHNMNDVLEMRRARQLPTYNMNQGLVRTHPSVAEVNLQTLQAADPSVLWQMGRVPGLDALRREVATWRQELFQEPISDRNVFITVGASNAFLLNLLALTDAGDKVQYITPYFFNHRNAGELLERNPVEIPLIEDHGFAFDLQRVATEWDSRTKLLVVSNPHNPTGVSFSSAQITELEQTVSGLGGWLIVDESYTGFDYTPNACPLSGLSLDSTLVQGSFSKVLSLGDIRIGYLIASEALVEVFTRMQDNLVICPPVLNQRIALAVLQQRERLLPSVIREMRDRSRAFDEALDSMSLKLKFTGNSGVFKWLYLGEGIDDEQCILELAKVTGVIATPGKYYGAPNWIRLTYGMLGSVDELQAACRALEDFLNQYLEITSGIPVLHQRPTRRASRY